MSDRSSNILTSTLTLLDIPMLHAMESGQLRIPNYEYLLALRLVTMPDTCLTIITQLTSSTLCLLAFLQDFLSADFALSNLLFTLR